MNSPSVVIKSPVPNEYLYTLFKCLAFFTLMLMAIVDFRRGFLFAGFSQPWGYETRTPFFIFSPMQLLLLVIGMGGLMLSYRALKNQEALNSSIVPEKYLRWFSGTIFALIVIDLFTYRGVAATRAAFAHKVGADWLNAFGVSGWLKPFALTGSYMLTVWHATFLGILLSGLTLTLLPRFLNNFITRIGLRGSFSGTLFSLTQPFCSCCASVIAPSMVRKGASDYFVLAFVVGAPMLNITTLILSAMLLPAPYAALRIISGVAFTLLVTYAAVLLVSHQPAPLNPRSPGRIEQFALHWMERYSKIFQFDKLLGGRLANTPATFIASWFSVSWRIALIVVPMLIVWSVVTAAIVQLLPSAFGNNLPSVLIAAVTGTLLINSTWSEIPIALQMINAGYPGPAATLLIVLPPVSLPCLLLLSGGLGHARIATALGVIIMLCGFLIGAAFI